MTKIRPAFAALIAAFAVFASWQARAQSVDELLKAAEEKIKVGDGDAARQIYERIIKQHPDDHPEVYVFRADLSSDTKAQIADYTKALAVAAKKPFPADFGVDEVYAHLAMAREELGDDKGAIATFTAGLKRFPKDPFLLQFRGEAQFLFGDCMAAAADYSAAIALIQQGWPMPYIERSRAYICTGDLARASEDFRAAAAQSENAVKRGSLEDLSAFDLDGWAATGRVAGKAAADKLLAARLAESRPPSDPDTAYDAAKVFLGLSEMSIIADDVAAIKAKTGDKSDGLDGDIYYYAGLKELVDGQDEAAIAHFQKIAALHDASFDQRRLSRSWIANIRHGQARAGH